MQQLRFLCVELCVSCVFAETRSSEGTDFYLTYLSNLAQESAVIQLSLSIAAKTASDVVVTSANGAFTPVALSLSSNQIQNVPIPTSDLTYHKWTTSGQITKSAIHVTASSAVTVTGYNEALIGSSTDSWLSLPKNALGTHYIVAGYAGLIYYDFYPSLFGMIGTEDDTTVTITPSTSLLIANADSKPAGIPFNITLNQYDVVVFASAQDSADVSGTEVVSNKAIAVFGGSDCSNVPTDIRACNHLVEQLVPVDAWGQTFITSPFTLKTQEFRIFSSENDNSVTIDGTIVTTLSKNSFYSFQATTPKKVVCAKSCQLVQYAKGGDLDGVGDPFMVVVPPVNQFLSSYIFNTAVGGSWLKHYVNIVVEKSFRDNVLMDGNPLVNPVWIDNTDADYSVAQYEISGGSHIISHSNSKKLGITVYGYRPYDAYGNVGGFAAEPLVCSTGGCVPVNDVISSCLIPPGETTCVSDIAEFTFPSTNNYSPTFKTVAGSSLLNGTNINSPSSGEILYVLNVTAILNGVDLEHFQFSRENPLEITIETSAFLPKFKLQFYDTTFGFWKNGDATCGTLPVRNATHITYRICHLTVFALVTDTVARDPILEWSYRLVCGDPSNPVATGIFTQVTGLQYKNEWECERFTMSNGRETTSCVPSQNTVTPVILRRPLSADETFWNWRDLVADGDLDNARVDCAIVLFNRAYKPVMEIDIFNAWPASVSINPLDTMSGSDRKMLFEEVILIHEGIYKDNIPAAFVVLDQ